MWVFCALSRPTPVPSLRRSPDPSAALRVWPSCMDGRAHRDCTTSEPERPALFSIWRAPLLLRSTKNLTLNLSTLRKTSATSTSILPRRIWASCTAPDTPGISLHWRTELKTMCGSIWRRGVICSRDSIRPDLSIKKAPLSGRFFSLLEVGWFNPPI